METFKYCGFLRFEQHFEKHVLMEKEKKRNHICRFILMYIFFKYQQIFKFSAYFISDHLNLKWVKSCQFKRKTGSSLKWDEGKKTVSVLMNKYLLS